MSQLKESLSIEETNKIRVSLGLKPLPVPGATTAVPESELSSEARAELNYARRRAEESETRKASQVQERVAKAKNKRELAARLTGRGIADLADDTDDLKQWVKRQKKQSKKLAAEALRKEREIAEQEAPIYGENDLEGLKVAHEIDEFAQGDEVVLTLKDSRILDAEDDELENVNMTEETRAKEALELKRKGATAGQYTGYDDEEFLNPGQATEVLSKYTVDIDGKKEKTFRLGAGIGAFHSTEAQGSASVDSGNRNTKKQTAELLKTGLMSLDYSSQSCTVLSMVLKPKDSLLLTSLDLWIETVGSDYIQEGDPGFKKPKRSKKKKDKSSRQPTGVLEPDELKPSASDQMEIDSGAAQPVVPALAVEDNVIDDEEIQAAMSRMRREAGKMRNKRKKKAEEPEPMEDVQVDGNVNTDLSPPFEDDDVDKPDALVIDDTSEFIRTVSLQQERAAAAKMKEDERKLARLTFATHVPSELGDEDLEKANSEVDEEEERRKMERLMTGDDDLTTATMKTEADVPEQDTAVYGATGSEKYVTGGMASTLSLLKAQGLIKPLTDEEREKERLYKEKTRWLVEQRRRDALREMEKERTKKMGDAKDQATREYENRMRESMMARESMEAFRNYKPDVEIKYNDEFGRELTQKEAWKALSHKFHGKGSGKAKTEKRIKKIEEEKKLAAMASGDTPTGTNEAFRKRQEKLGSATMILSVGNKGSAPHQEEFLSSLTKSSAGGSKKPKESKAKALGHNTLRTHQHTISAAPDLMNGLGNQLNSGIRSTLDGFQTPGGMMAPRKAGFKPIATQKPLLAAVFDPHQNGNPGNLSKSKISIGLNGSVGSGSSSRDGKRKAEDGADESHRSKQTG